MLNLLNREKRYELRREYFGRLRNVFLIILIFCVTFWGILLFTNYFSISIEKNIFEEEFEKLQGASVQKQIAEYEEKLNHLKIEYELFAKNPMSPTYVLDVLSTKIVAGISVDLISISKTDKEGIVNLEIKGTAKDRNSLLEFSNVLKSDPLFAGVNIPLSSLTKTAEIPFSISMSFNYIKKDEK